MARNRKRAKERRARRPEPVAAARPDRRDSPPVPISHAAPDAEMAEAQIALGGSGVVDEAADDRPLDESEAGLEEPAPDEEEAFASTASHLPERRGHAGNRVVNFVQGSWRELQRVQWPDRRQVMQATGVVIGFVIVAGLYLALADTVASRLMNFILK